jgi:hypothetical protein
VPAESSLSISFIALGFAAATIAERPVLRFNGDQENRSLCKTREPVPAQPKCAPIQKAMTTHLKYRNADRAHICECMNEDVQAGSSYFIACNGSPDPHTGFEYRM